MADRRRGPSATQRLLARGGDTIALAIPLTYGGAGWLQWLHQVEGGREAHEPGLVAHWLRDATLALPLVLTLAVALVLAADHLVRRAGIPRASLLGRLTSACAAALGAAVAFGLGSPVHGTFFGANHGHHHLNPLVHVLRDGALALAACLVLAVLVTEVIAGVRRVAPGRAVRPGPTLPNGRAVRPGRIHRRRSAAPSLVARASLALALAGPVVVAAQDTVQQAAAGSSAGAPCPAGAPLKRFAVQAIDVDITLNRFGDHDPAGKMYVLAEDVPAVRIQEASRTVSVGLRDDAIQPLVIRANLGDCVQVDFTNHASGGEFGMHVDGVAFDAASSGDAIGRNAASSVPTGGSRTYRYYVPQDPELEGTHYIRPGPGNRQAVSHGLFGALAVEPAGSVYLHPDTGLPLRSGWEAMIRPEGKAAFREYVKVYHEVGDENAQIIGRDGHPLPTVDPITDSYRPGSRAINYRSEPFIHRLERAENEKALAYNSYTFGDPATPIMRAYSSDPTKIRIIHGGSELFHVYHLHGGGIRWPQNPRAASFDYSAVGLDKNPKLGGSNRLDSQSFGPGESYSLEIEGGAGGVQRAIGDLLEHCHIAEHYVSGMWSFWRIFNTRHVDLQPLPDRAPPPQPVDSADLIGRTMPDGTVLTKDTVGEWVEQLLPPRGVPKSDTDASVWNWSVDRSDPLQPVYLGEPEDTSTWADLNRSVPGHPAAMAGDTFVGSRPRILFNPVDGRPAYPLLRPHIGQRSPQAPAGHSGAPFLGGTAGASATRTGDVWAKRPDGLCPANAPVRRYDLTTIQLPIRVTDGGGVDPTGKIFVLDEDKAAVRAGDKPAEPLALRANIGDCVALTLVTELENQGPGLPLPRANMHIHHVQFDPQGSDGASAGMVYDQSVLPYRMVDPRLAAAAAAGDTTLALDSVAKFQVGVWVAVGEGEPRPEIRQIAAIDTAASTITLDRALDRGHAAGEWAGTEFVQLRWYPDVDLDNVFWHDHVDGIHGWGKGLVGQLIVEPRGSTYHDPRTGAEVRSGNYVDIHAPNPLAPGLVNGSFRELALWTIDDNPVTDSTLNLRAAPWADRLARDPDPSLLFSSWRHGDPNTPLPEAYKGDPFVVRTVNVSAAIDSLHLTGHRFFTEPRLLGADGKPASTPQDSVQYGVSAKFTAILEGGAGGTRGQPGDYLYMNGVGRRFRHGAWGLLRVLGRLRPDLQPLPGTSVAEGGSVPEPTGGRPPVAPTAGMPCPAGAPQRQFGISAVDVPATAALPAVRAAFVPSDVAGDVAAGRRAPEPLVLHAAAGECVTVRFENARRPGADPEAPRASFHVDKLARAAESSGVNAGFDPEQTVPPGGSRTYRYYVDSDRIGSATIADFGGADTGTAGLYGAFVVAPAGATFTDPATGDARDVGAQVDVHLPGGTAYRDASLLLSDDDAQIGANTMPYPVDVKGNATVNYRSEPRVDDAMAFSSQAHGDPSTPIVRAHAGDPVRVHVLNAPGSEQPHAFSLGGLSWPSDPTLPHSTVVSAAAVSPWMGFDAHLAAGEGGTGGDYWYGDLRRPFTQAGMWGLVRFLPVTDCSLRPLRGGSCGVPAAGPGDPPAPGSGFSPDPGSASGGGSGSTSGGRARSDDGSRDGGSGSGGGGSSASDLPRLRRLEVTRRVSLGQLRRHALRVAVTVSDAPVALQLSLVRAGARAASQPLILRTVGARRRGRAEFRWRLTRTELRRLRAGRYLFAVRIPSGSASVSRAIQVVGGH